MTSSKNNAAAKSRDAQKSSKEIKTDFPLSEKDEVKKAEQKVSREVKKK